MITGSYYDNDILKSVTNFYLTQISKPYLIKFFHIYFTNDILEDIKPFNNGNSIDIPSDGVTILPISPNDLITILINENTPIELQPQYIFHELCHMHDFLLFANKYCDGAAYLIREDKYLSTLKSWSEFHVQLYIMPYYFSFISVLSNKKQNFNKSFVEQIGTFYYNKFNEKFLSKEEIHIFDIMYYLGDITMCNLNDDAFYPIDKRIIKQYPFIEELNSVLRQCITFDSFCHNIQTLHQILSSLT